MKHAILLTFLGVLMLVLSTATAADGPKLVNEKQILPDNENWKISENQGINSMRLSPDGKHLLYIRWEKVNDPEENRQRRIYRIVLRNIASGKDKTLPIPAYRNGEIAVIMLSMNVFDTTGKRIVLGVGIDANGDGRHDHRQEKMKPVVYDIASGKTKDLSMQDDIIIPTFDRTGKGFIIIAADKQARTGKLITMRTEKASPKVHHIWGLPRGVCPAADVLSLLLPPDRNAGRRENLVLYDLKADKQIAKLPTHEKNTKLDDYNPQWTGDGRYLYYVDMKDDAAGGPDNPKTKPITRIWDRKTNKEGGIVDSAIPIGPGPGKTTMVLGKPLKGVMTPKGYILHDAATGKSWPLCDNFKRVITAQGKYVIYVKKTLGKPGAYMAEIVLPGKAKDAKDAKDKKTTSRPAKTKPPKIKKP